MPLFEKRDVSLTSPPQWLIDALGGGSQSYAGENVSPETALTVPTVLACLTVLAEDISSLPLILYRRLERGKERATDNPYYALLHDAPNPEHTAMVFRELLVGHLLAWGNSFSQIITDGRGRAVELWPLHPGRMEVGRENGRKKYLYTSVDNKKIAFRTEQILHIPAFGYDGLTGYSKISLARNAIGLSIAAQKYGSKFFKNDARPAIAIKLKNSLKTKESQDAFRSSWNQIYQGGENAWKVGLLEEGAEIQEIGIPPEDAQFIETQKWTVADMSRVFRIPPHMIGDVERSTSWGSGIEQQELGYLNHTLRPWLTRIEQQFNKDLLLSAERGQGLFYEHLTDGMLRTDTAARYQAYASAITNGWMTRNEARERENFNVLPDLDEPLVPLNMSKASEPDQSPDGKPVDSKTRGFVLDAARRILRREVNELIDAQKRWLEKGKADKFNAWLEQFYKRDHAQFILKTLEPLGADVEQVVGNYCLRNGQTIAEALAGDVPIESVTDLWMDSLPEELTDALLGKEQE